MPIRAVEYRVEHALRSELQCRHGPGSIRVCRYADLPPAFRIGGTRRLGLAGVLNAVTADQKMCGQTITSGQTKDNLSHLGRIAILMAPARLQRLDHAAHGRFIVREQIRSSLFARAPQSVRIPPVSRAQTLTPKGPLLSRATQ
jgi:hypothetical protein